MASKYLSLYQAFDKETSTTVAIKKMAYSGKQAGEKWADILKEVCGCVAFHSIMLNVGITGDVVQVQVLL